MGQAMKQLTLMDCKEKECKWTILDKDNPFDDLYEDFKTECGKDKVFLAVEDIQEYNYCPYCGGKLILFTPEPEGEGKNEKTE